MLITMTVAMSGILAVTGCAVGEVDQAPSQQRTRPVTSSPLPAAPSDEMAAGNLVSITGSGPVPRQLIAGTGETISWRNDTAKTVSVGLIDGSKPSGAIPPGGAYTHVFDTAGSYAYRIGKSGDPVGVVEIMPQSDQVPVPAS
ncbi:hypothetical protein Psi02_11530 [Planotetraspora silvatica]|uniref:Uncharacterized protein n=1 Tax=Planotetraspora silvatica TaxID=234614 RepID=A0A8J3UM00_9ACTN|nr:hypothetical protein [Planotetraspora silvatica]GII44729.1 hypothetical protein Psi02_11530 [Planotetraspora silvatica]